jgi:hypothetical protein
VLLGYSRPLCYYSTTTQCALNFKKLIPGPAAHVDKICKGAQKRQVWARRLPAFSIGAPFKEVAKTWAAENLSQDPAKNLPAVQQM